MIRDLAIILALLCLILGFFLYRKEQQLSELKLEISNQKNQVKDEIIEDKKQVQQRKVINSKATTSDNLKWLREYRCIDCKK